MNSGNELHAAVGALLGEKSIEGFFNKAQEKADAVVAKSKKTKDMSVAELEDFRHLCLQKAGWEQLRAYAVDLTQPRILSWRYAANVGIQATATAMALTGGFLLLSVISGKKDSDIVRTETTDTTGNSPWEATQRPTKKGPRALETAV